LQISGSCSTLYWRKSSGSEIEFSKLYVVGSVFIVHYEDYTMQKYQKKTDGWLFGEEKIGKVLLN